VIPQDFLTHIEAETPDNPFPGLRPFEFGESHLYFGRDGQSDQLIRKLAATRFVAVVGTSGSGKSSLVRAGLLPDLFSGYMSTAGSHWRVALMRPSNDPLGNLATALNSTGVFGSEIEENVQIQTAITEATLRRGSLGLVEVVRQNRMASNESLLVVVDQFEELFRFARVSASEQYRYEAAAFVKLLLDASAQREHAVYVVLTMRSDFLGDCSMFWDLPEAINEGQYLIPRLTRDQRMEAIAGPVAVCGGDITQRLVNRLLNDVGDNPDQLPILQHALMRTWEDWKADHEEGEPIDLRHYEAIGGMGEALSRHADEAGGELPDERARLVAEKVFKALTEKGEDNREVRRPVELKALCELTDSEEAEVVSVVDVFRRTGRSFLMPPAAVPLEADSLVDISHESLIRNWGRLKAWVDEESVSAQIYRRLAETAVLHAEGRAGLWRDPDLQIALDWRERARPNGAWAARYHPAFDAAMRFLDESVEARDAAARAAEERRRREVRRARVVAVVFFLLFMLSLVAVAVAYNKTLQAQVALSNLQEATRQTTAALAQARQAAENERAAKQTEAEQREKAEKAEAEAVNKQKEAEAAKADALRQAEIARTNERLAERAKAEEMKQRETAVAQTERSRQLLYAADINLAQQAYEATSVARGRELLEQHKPGGGDAPGFDWYYLWRLFHSESHTLFAEGRVSAIALSPDDKKLAVAANDWLWLYDLGTRKPLWDIRRTLGHNDTLAMSPRGDLLAVGGDTGDKLKLIDMKSGGEVRTLPLDYLGALAFSPDGKLLAAGDSITNNRDVVSLWDVDSGEPLFDLDGDGGRIRTVAFSPDGRTIAAGSVGGFVMVWDVASRKRMDNKVMGHDRSVTSLAFWNDGDTLISGGEDGKVTIWNTRASRAFTTFESGTTPVSSLALSADGTTLTVGYTDGAIKLGKMREGLLPDFQVVTALKGHESHISSLALSGDGKQLVSGSADKTVKVWDVAALGLEHSPLAGHHGEINAVAFSPDGKLIASGGGGKTLVLRRADTGKEVCSVKGRMGEIRSVAFSPDGKLLVAVGNRKDVEENPVGAWDSNSCAELAMPRGLLGLDNVVISVAFSPVGQRLAVGSRHRKVVLLDSHTFKQIGSPLVFARPVMSVAFSPDGKRLAVGLGDGAIALWDVASPTPSELLRLPAEGAGEVFSLAFLPGTGDRPGRRLLAAGFNDGTVKLFDADTGKEVSAPLRGHKQAVFSVAFSPDGRTLASGSLDTTVKLWDAASFKELITLEGHDGAVMSVAFSPDGKTLVTGSFDQKVRLWHAATDKEVKEFGAADHHSN
jgi:WD40 repeat protein/flagellar biosynthesis GTPase FlhF/energy-coupling factor transporter ATP-binding protein EcfA2